MNMKIADFWEATMCSPEKMYQSLWRTTT